MYKIKFIYLILIFSFLLGCNSQKSASNNENNFLQEISCPEGGDCIFKVLKDSNLEIKKDDFGELYPEIVPGDKVVIKYHFKKKENKNIADDNYSEFIYLEIDKNEENLILKDKELQKVKLLFGRICFCRGSMGYYKVTQGELFLLNNNEILNMKLKFKVNKVPQIVTKINENIKY
ncbi:MAG: hypothetical protein L3J08_03615 [Flavobacteriaceae bacterium]|nr:hypothetical protein [Flavobacteriaceae bacterium]